MPRPVHFEIPADDVARATKFFTDVFGWKFEGWGDDNYLGATTGEEGTMGINGAVMKRMHPEQPVSNAIEVPSVDDYAAKVTANGGTIVFPKAAVPNMGYYAYFKDTEGNIHGLWQVDKAAK
jgi:predicted enzyme related to lactoylglutathione lyase